MGKVPKFSGNKKLQLSVNFLRDQKRLAQLLRQFFLANIENTTSFKPDLAGLKRDFLSPL